MAVSTAAQLTKQFYEWEKIGRGWHKADFSVQLEPPFTPFFGHFIENETIIDDGKRETWLSSLFKSTSAPIKPKAVFKEADAFAYTSDSLLSIFRIVLPKQYKHNGERTEQLLTMLSYRKSPICFELIGSCDDITIQLVCREEDEAFLTIQLQAFFHDCTVIETYNDQVLNALEQASAVYTIDFGLQEEFMRPIASITGGDIDPYAALFGVMTRLEYDEYIIVQMLFSGTHNPWADSIQRAVSDNAGKQSFFFDAPEMPQQAKEKISRPLFGATIRTATVSGTLAKASILLQHAATALVHASTGTSNCLMPLGNTDYTVEERLIDIVMRESHRVGMLLNSRELATFVHFPSPALSKKLLNTNRTTKAAPYALVDEPYVLGLNVHQGIEREVGINTSQRLRHLHIIGSTGTGKSTLMHSLIMQDIKQGNGCCVIDPHGDLVDMVLRHIPEERITDVVFIDPSDSDYPIGLNILSAHSDLEKELLASDLVALFRRFSTSWGDQMNSVFANAISAFVYNKKVGTLSDLRKFLIEQPFRNAILSTCTDPDIVYYWQKEFPILKSSSIGSILTRLDSFLRPKVIRNMVAQKQSLNFAELMDTSKIVLVKLSQGLLGEENSYLLGAFIVSKLQQTAMARQAQAAITRVPFFCYIDEFQHFVTPSMVSILSGARKYGLGLILAHQDMQQVSKVDADIASTLIANAGTRIVFRLGDTDSKRLQEGFSAFTAEDMQQLQTGEAIARVNTRDNDFNIDVIPYAADTEDTFVEEIIEHTRSNYSVPIAAPTVIDEIPPEQQKPQAAVEEPVQPKPVALVPSPNRPKPADTDPKPEQVREHRYLQTLFKKMAEERGYKAMLEVPLAEGKGQVDVVLEKDGRSIAVEISVSTTAEWELHNIEKCLGEPYSKIVVCSKDAKKLQHIRQLATARFSSDQLQKLHFLAPDEFQSVITEDKQTQSNNTVIKGYRVKVQYEQGATNKADLLRSIVNASKKP